MADAKERSNEEGVDKTTPTTKSEDIDNEGEEGVDADDGVQDLRMSSLTTTECVHDCTHRWVLAQQRRQ
jgi:hypothetical protein